MHFPLGGFEEYVEDRILKRGRTYFNNGQVGQCEDIAPGLYEAVVSGSEDYTVRLSIDNALVREHVCDCPYDMGPMCKHVVAFLYYLRDEFEPKKPAAKRRKPAKSIKRKTLIERVNDLLEKVSRDELNDFVRERATEDRLFRDLFLSSFSNPDAPESKAFYAGQIKSILRSSSDRLGFIDWNGARRLSASVYRLLDLAKKGIKKRNYMGAAYICEAVMEQMIEALQYVDDSDGDIGGHIRYAVDILDGLVETSVREDVRQHLLDYCLSTFDKSKFEGWDFHMDILRLASRLITTEEELQQLFARTTRDHRSDYARKVAEEITFSVLLKIRGEKEAEKYLEDHIENPDLRTQAIKRALEKKQSEKDQHNNLNGRHILPAIPCILAKLRPTRPRQSPVHRNYGSC
jgi:hypothetical protein